MKCTNCGQNGVVDICPSCGCSYINKATNDYIKKIEGNKDVLESKGYNYSNKKKRKDTRAIAKNHTLEPWNQ